MKFIKHNKRKEHIMNEKEFEYFFELHNDYNAMKSINLLQQYMYAKFKRKFSIQELAKAEERITRMMYKNKLIL